MSSVQLDHWKYFGPLYLARALFFLVLWIMKCMSNCHLGIHFPYFFNKKLLQLQTGCAFQHSCQHTSQIVVNSIKCTIICYGIKYNCWVFYHFCRIFCTNCNWSSMELLAAALCLPGTVGWSGMVESQSSSQALKLSGVPVKVSLIPLGMELNRLAPLTCKEVSLALFTAAGALLKRGASTISLPLLSFWVKVAL